jgi:hypothetical protein
MNIFMMRQDTPMIIDIVQVVANLCMLCNIYIGD